MSKQRQRLFASVGLLALGIVTGLLIAQFGPAAAGAAQQATPAANSPTPALDEVIPQGAFVRVAEQVKPALVYIRTEQTVESFSLGQVPEFFRRFLPDDEENRGEVPDDQIQFSQGSGFIISSDGYIVTNGHVVSRADLANREVNEADSVTVRLANEEEFEARIVGVDIGTDLAVLKVDAGYDLSYLAFGDSDAAKVGEWVMALGAPFGLTNTVSAGIISAKGRGNIPGMLGTNYRDFIQTDAAINRGNSGGPLVNLRGEVIAINTAIISNGLQGQFAGVGFAIPMNLVSGVVDQLMEHGRVIRGWLGISMMPLDPELAEGFGIDPREVRSAVIIESVNPDEPADQAGVQVGDIVVGTDGVTLDGNQDFLQRIAVKPPDETIALDIIRIDENWDRRDMHIDVTLGERPAEIDVLADTFGRSSQPTTTRRPQTGSTELEGLGMSVSELNDRWADELGYDIEDGGVVVTRVTRGGPAFRANLGRGTIIFEVNRQPVNSVDELERLIAEIDHEIAVLRVRFLRGQEAYVPLRLPDGR